ncbi:Elongation factor G [Candidatus Izimaplasma bacterium HR1]|jgi:elongation factor G|uniref:elongation factor G n=1 Tax=Candidatus Izimoplasma sp. HR1 TaxID=1541959 RepID=UPI0004F6DE26|nr:Elongation factor G [Candidatus Izimaplasma bacterium HR1]
MKQYDTNHLRSIAVVGAPGSGKTSFMESVLQVTGAIAKKGSVEQKSTTSDYLPEEKDHQSSISTSIIPVEYNGYKMNFLDTPGHRELISEVEQALSVVKGAVIMIDASKGIDIATNQVLSEVEEVNIPTVIFLNKMEKDNVKFETLVAKLRESMGNKAVPFFWPIVKDEKFEGYVDLVDLKTRVLENGKVVEKDVSPELMDIVGDMRESIMESVAETSEDLLDKYFGGEPLTRDEIVGGLRKGVLNGDLKPVLAGTVLKNIGIPDLLEIIEKFFPAPNELQPVKGHLPKSEETAERTSSNDEPFSGYCFNTIIDPFIGSISMIKVFSGTVQSGDKVIVSNTGDSIKIGTLSLLRGKEQIDTDRLVAGDIGIVTKLDEIKTGYTICDSKNPIIIDGPAIPGATIFIAIHPKNKKDEDKISTALHKLVAEDPSFEYKRNRETSQLLIGGQGMVHINLVIEKLKNVYKVEVDQSEPKIVYRETITKKCEAEGRHKKQSGGSGQFGVVKIRFEPINPNESTFEFDEEIHGGSVPRGYWPAVEKGLIDHFQVGPLAGFPVIGVKAVLFDGSYHSVDSNEISFKLAAAIAFKNALKDAKPTILEPIMKVSIIVRDEYVGDVMGDINKRRGQLLGMDILNGKQRIIAEVPENEIVSYTIDLKAMTQGTGVFQREFVRYDQVPNHLIDSIIEEFTKED